jgi:hypothetical protein
MRERCGIIVFLRGYIPWMMCHMDNASCEGYVTIQPLAFLDGDLMLLYQWYALSGVIYCIQSKIFI